MKKRILFVTTIMSGLICLSTFSFAFSRYKKTASDISIKIAGEVIVGTGYFVDVYNGATKRSTTETVVNPSNVNEVMIIGLQAYKGDTIRFRNKDNTEFGTSTSYTHNISVGCSVSSGLVTSNGYYVAVQDGTYNIYYKFNESSHTTYLSTHVDVNEVKTLYLQDTWGENYSPAIHYWGNNVFVSENDNYYGGSKMETQEGGHNMYKVLIPLRSTELNIYYQSKYSINSLTLSQIGNDNSIYVDWSDGMIIGHYYWTNPR